MAADRYADGHESPPHEPDSPHPENAPWPPKHDDAVVDIIWYNLDSDGEFMVSRQFSRRPIERILSGFGKLVSAGFFDQIISVNASKFSLVVVFGSKKSRDEVMAGVSMVEFG